jgi:integrase
MGAPRKCLPVAEWPPRDRALWQRARRSGDFLDEDGAANHLSPARAKLDERGYGRFLAELQHRGELDPDEGPADRATPERLAAFAETLRASLAPVSVTIMTEALWRMLRLLAAEHDWTALGKRSRQLQRQAQPVRQKAARVQPAGDLLTLGLRLMETCEEVALRPKHVMTQYRDGLMIALLICCPVRLRNFTAIVVGQHLTVAGDAWRLGFAASESKNGRAYSVMLPELLTPYLDTYLELHHAGLQAIGRAKGLPEASLRHLWLGCRGGPMCANAIRHQIEARTAAAFGRHVWPHLFRDCAVTELVDIAPEEIGIAAGLLGHARLETTQKHYIQAQGMTAHLRVQELIDRLRQTPPDDGAG